MVTEINQAETETIDSSSTFNDSTKKRQRMIVGSIIALVLLASVALWWLHSRAYEETDDAQIDGHLHPVAARINGTVVAVYAEDNQPIEAGTSLIDLDPKDNEVSLQQAQAAYDQALAQVSAEHPNLPITLIENSTDIATGRAGVANAEASLSAAEHDLTSTTAQLRQAEANDIKAQTDLTRYTRLVEKQEVAQSDYDHYVATAKAQAATVEQLQASVRSAAKAIDQRRAQLIEQQSRLDQSIKNAPGQIQIREANNKSRQASAESAAAQLEQAKLNLSYTKIVAPVSGIITQRNAETGERVSPGQQLMMVVETGNLWVIANFKETQLKRMHNGQRATIHVDTLEEDFEGYVENMPAATGDRTSVLPPENATGNYVKIVQRLPVRIRFKPSQRDLDKLRPGMSVVPKVDLT